MNMQAIMKQAQALQKDMMKAKEEIDSMNFVGESSLVKVTVSGSKEVLKVEVDKSDSLTGEDIEMLEDMIVIATNAAFKQVDEITEQKMGKFGGGMPGLF